MGWVRTITFPVPRGGASPGLDLARGRIWTWTRSGWFPVSPGGFGKRRGRSIPAYGCRNRSHAGEEGACEDEGEGEGEDEDEHRGGYDGYGEKDRELEREPSGWSTWAWSWGWGHG